MVWACDDELTGNEGSDYLIGGLGHDDYYGGSGADTFVISENNIWDEIYDFNLSEGDKLDTSSIITGYEPFNDALSNFLKIGDNGTHSFVHIDADGLEDRMAGAPGLEPGTYGFGIFCIIKYTTILN